MKNSRHGKETMTIGIFTGYYLPHLGGVERYVDKLSAELAKIGYRIVIVTSNHDDLPPREVYEDKVVYRLPISSFAKNRYPIPILGEAYSSVMREVEQEKIDVFLLNTRFHLTSLVGGRLAYKQNKPAIVIEHGTGHFTVNNAFLDFFGKIYEHLLTMRIKRYAKAYYGVSAACNDWLKHFGISASGVFYNAINSADAAVATDKYEHLGSDGSTIITYAGRLIKEKGIVNLIESFVQVVGDKPQKKVFLTIAGDGPLSDELHQKYNRPDILFMGRLDFKDVMSLYKRTNIFVYPSLYPEGLPTSILEAGLMNCAVIATPRGGTAEVIKNGEHGIITDGSVADLSKSLERLLSDRKETKRLADNLKRRVNDSFTWKVVAATVDQTLRKGK